MSLDVKLKEGKTRKNVNKTERDLTVCIGQW